MPLRSFALLPLCVLALGACGPSSPETHARTPEDPWVVGMSQCNLGEPWRVQMNEDVRTAAAGHSNLTAPLTRPVAEAYQRGIPVIVLDREVQGDEFTTFIGADNVRIGREAGAWIRETLGEEGKIVELKGLMTSTPGQDRNRGFLEGLGLEENPGLEIVFTGEMQWLEPNARREMESALATNPQIDVVYAHNDPGAHGAWLAARAAGREDDILFVGIDALPHEGQQYVQQGILDATFLYPTGGAEAIEAALAILQGEEVPKRIVLGTRLFAQEKRP